MHTILIFYSEATAMITIVHNSPHIGWS